MNQTTFRIRAREPLLFRDGRPFSAELGALAAQTLPLPFPSAIAGTLRTRLGNRLGWDWANGGPDEARATPVRGPILCGPTKSSLSGPLFPAPADALVYRPETADPADADERQSERLRPVRARGGTDLPGGLYPVGVPRSVKPAGAPYWPAELLTGWLAGGAGPTSLTQLAKGPEIEERVHVAIDPQTGRAEDGRLFSTASLAMGDEWTFLAAVDHPDAIQVEGLFPFGGEQRLAAVDAEPDAWPACPDELATKLGAPPSGITLYLASPAHFRDGWRPGWLDGDLRGSPPGLDVQLRLVGAAVPRSQAVSGWDYQAKGPRPVRRLAPAGSVYFFVLEGGAAPLLASDGWLSPISDDPQARRDGFGMALWGVWDAAGF